MNFGTASVDTALQKLETAGRPIRVGMVGAGATGRAIALQLATPVPGMRLVAIANRTPEVKDVSFFAGTARIGLAALLVIIGLMPRLLTDLTTQYAQRIAP